MILPGRLQAWIPPNGTLRTPDSDEIVILACDTSGFKYKEDRPVHRDSTVIGRAKTFVLSMFYSTVRGVTDTLRTGVELNKSLIARRKSGNGTDGEQAKKTKLRTFTHNADPGSHTPTCQQSRTIANKTDLYFKRKKPRPESRARLFETGE
ncbi:hypothetical protein [Azospirillum sp. TSO35-2]|uniref:hypothetical protein n=1 Tax=Azospirillum sp. TSO35-2 TaxID=716796 RepID=UPI0011B3E437|nr:hypothetical protein [Azospirillum sp. TSO35-2]